MPHESKATNPPTDLKINRLLSPCLPPLKQWSNSVQCPSIELHSYHQLGPLDTLLTSSALCNLLKKGCRHRKWEIWWNSFTIKICIWWFWMFQNYFVTVFLHISLKSQNSFTNKICIWQLWGVFWPFSPVFLLSNIKTWFFPNKIKVRGSSK